MVENQASRKRKRGLPPPPTRCVRQMRIQAYFAPDRPSSIIPIEALVRASHDTLSQQQFGKEGVGRFYRRKGDQREWLRALWKSIKARYFTYTPPPSMRDYQRRTSSIQQGLRVHRQLYHATMCCIPHATAPLPLLSPRSQHCICTDKKTRKWNQLTLDALQLFSEHSLVPRASELIIAHGPIATRLDVLCERNGAFVCVSIKTGYSSDLYRNPGIKMRAPLDRLNDSPQNRNQLQALVEVCILREEYHIDLEDYWILYLGYHKTTGLHRLERKRDMWWALYSREEQNAIFATLT